jgi:hypothetical protein
VTLDRLLLLPAVFVLGWLSAACSIAGYTARVLRDYAETEDVTP